MKDHIINEGGETTWLFRDGGMYLEKGGQEYKVKCMRLCANGTKDIYMVRTNDSALELRLKGDILENDEIIHHYQDDIVIMDFEKPYPYGTPYLYLEMTEKSVPMIEMALKLFYTGDKGDRYDAYLGREYTSIS